MYSMLWLRPDVEAGTGLDVMDVVDIRSPLSPVVQLKSILITLNTESGRMFCSECK